MRFRKVPVKVVGQVPEVGADTSWDLGGFWSGYLARFRKVSAQMPGKVPDSSGADAL